VASSPPFGLPLLLFGLPFPLFGLPLLPFPPHTPSTQRAPNVVHGVPQAPQLFMSVLTFVQMPLQLVCPCGHVHCPPAHDAPPVHTLLQAPQFQLSVCASMQVLRQ